MSIIASVGVYSRSEDWIVAGAFVAVAYLVIYPLYIRYLRKRFTRRIEGQMVTNAYNLPIKMTPVEIAYIFSTRVNANQIYATLLDLANRSILVLEKRHGVIFANMGPKLEKDLRPFEKILVGHIFKAQDFVKLEHMTQGSSKFSLKSGEKVQGSKQYVFWWLLRYTLRQRKIIETRMTGRYLRMLFNFTVLGGFIVSVFPLMMFRLVQLFESGNVNFDVLVDSFFSGLYFWLLFMPVIIIIGFLMLRFKGRMLGRSWLLTAKYKRYLNQMDAFREFVRLTHSGKLEFESKELKESAISHTRPYAIAFGFVKKY